MARKCTELKDPRGSTGCFLLHEKKPADGALLQFIERVLSELCSALVFSTQGAQGAWSFPQVSGEEPVGSLGMALQGPDFSALSVQPSLVRHLHLRGCERVCVLKGFGARSFSPKACVCLPLKKPKVHLSSGKNSLEVGGGGAS